MATQSVTYRSCNRICCGGDLPVDVVLCIPQEIIAMRTCFPEFEEVGTYDFSFIYAQMTLETKVSVGCNGSAYDYTFTYDDSLLIEGAVLDGTQISGVLCTSCWTQYIIDVAGDEVYIETDPESGEQTLFTQHGCSYPILGEPILSPDADNCLEARENGFYVPCNPYMLGVDTVTVFGPDNSIATNTTLMSLLIPGGTLSDNGDRLLIRASGEFLRLSAEARLIVFTILGVGGFELTVDQLNEAYWRSEVEIIRTGANSCSINGQIFTLLEQTFYSSNSPGAVDWSIDQTIAFQSATLTAAQINQTTQNSMTVEFWKGP